MPFSSMLRRHLPAHRKCFPVLKEAGVVDSGGQGLLEVFRGAFDGYLGKEIDYSAFEKVSSGPAVTRISQQAEADIKFGYCTEFIILLNKPLPDEELHSFKEFLTSIGDSIVLVADDEIIERKVLLKTLQKNLEGQCELFQAENGREALEIYEKEKIQIAILDIEMPGINGIQAAEKIREKDKNCCIIFLTAYDEFSYAKKAITVRALDYILKPWDEKELMLVLEEAMRLAGEKEEQTRIRKVAEQAEAGQQIMEEEPDYANENLRISKVTEMLKDYICENYMKDLSVQQMAEKTNYSEPHFCRLFKQSFGQNFTSYLTEYRINMAKKMLEQPTVNVKDVGKNVGYEDSNYFTKVFRRITGQSPTEYRNTVFREKG